VRYFLLPPKKDDEGHRSTGGFGFRRRILEIELERAGGELSTVEEDLVVERSLLVQGEGGGVGAVTVVVGVDLDRRVAALDGEFIASEVLVLAVFVPCLDGKGEAGEASGGVVGSRAAVEVEGGIFDGRILKINFDRHWAGFLSSIAD